jgi:hypothetical protein
VRVKQRRKYKRNHSLVKAVQANEKRGGRSSTTREMYEAMSAAQGGVCAICRNLETATFGGGIRKLAVDHDHSTGKIRGLLCQACNTGLGLFKDIPERMELAAQYIWERQ